MVDRIETDGNADHHGDHRQGIEEGGQKRSSETKRQREGDFIAQIQQQFGEHIQQELLHEVDASDHENQQ